MWTNLMTKLVTALDPKLEKYRWTVVGQPKVVEKKVQPKTMPEFIEAIRKMPQDVLTTTDRARIAAVMSFDERTVADLMVAKAEMVFVNEADLLGPLMLDKLYKSGFTNFPVVDNAGKVKGVIHTEALNTLEIKKTDRAAKYMDTAVRFLHTGDALEYVVDEIGRTNAHYFLVLDGAEKLAGFLTVEMLLQYLLGE